MIKIKNLYFRTIVLLVRKKPQMVVYSIALTAFTVVFPYINVLISSELIDELANWNFKNIIFYASLLVVSDFILGIIISWGQKKVTKETESFLTFQTKLLAERAACVPYEIFVSNEYQNRKRRLDELSDETGANLLSVIDLAKRVVGTLISFIVTTATLSNILVRILRAENESYPMALIFLLAVNLLLVIITIISSYCIQRSKNHVEDKILPNYKIMWYLDREYLRFKKTAKEIRIFNQAPKVLSLLENANKQINTLQDNHDKTTLRGNVIIELTKQLSDLSVYIVFGLIIFASNMTIGQFNKATQMSRAVYDNIIGLSLIVGDCRRVSRWLNVFWAYYDTDTILFESVSKSGCNKDDDMVSFDKVGFKYSDSSSFAINDVNISIKRGEHIAIVGKNGSGKSTLVMLMCGLLKPSHGDVIVGGQEPSPMMFSTIFQDYSLFSLPINENVAVTCEPDLYGVVNAMRSAGISEKLTNKHEAYLYRQLDPEGIEVSGGEGQKIAIARAFYKNTDILIMDEPTSSLDPISEAQMYERIHSTYRDKTIVFISHRLSSCKFCDRIFVMENGSVIQIGTHNQLVDDPNGRYSELWHAQAQYYQS